MPNDPLHELFTGPQAGGGPAGAGTSPAGGSQAGGPLGWNPARRKPRAIWCSASAGPGVGTQAAGWSSPLVVRAGRSARPVIRKAGLYAALPPVGPTPPPLRGLSLSVRRRPGAGRIWPLQYPCRVPLPVALHGIRVVRRRGEDVARRRPGWLALARTMGVAFSGRLHYNIYSNTGIGDPVVYSSPVGAVMGTTWTTPVLAAPGNWGFGVRAADVNGEEQNLDCAVAIILDTWGNDITGRPAPPVGLRAFPLAGGAVRVEWSYSPTRGLGAPSGFHVYIGAGANPDYSTPAAQVAYGAGVFNAFVADLSGQADGTSYVIGVRAFNTSGEETNTATVRVTADATGPMPVDLLIATAIV